MRRSLLLTPLLLLAGCGGGSGAPEDPLDQALVCGTSFATPNYVTQTDPSTSRANRILAWPSFPITVYAPERGSELDGDLVERAMERWVEASARNDEELSYRFVDDAEDADVEIYFEELDEAPGPGDTLAQTELNFNSGSGLLSKSIVTMYTWPQMTEEEATDGLRGTLTHEIGHALFLSGHSPDDDDVMFPSSSAEVDTLVSDQDANSIQTAYCATYPSRSRAKVVPDSKILIREPRGK